MSEENIEEQEVAQEELDNVVEESGEGTSISLDKNTKILIGGLAVVVLAIGGWWAWNKFFVEPAELKAQDEIWWAQNMVHFKEDYKSALQGDTLGLYEGFESLSDEVAGTNAEQIKNYETGIAYLNDGQYDMARQHLQNVDFGDVMVTTIAKGAIGDSYMQEGDANNAISFYEQAINNSDNDFTCPLYLKKCAFAHESLQQWDAAIAHYERIKKDFPNSAEAEGVDKYIVKAKSM